MHRPATRQPALQERNRGIRQKMSWSRRFGENRRRHLRCAQRPTMCNGDYATDGNPHRLQRIPHHLQRVHRLPATPGESAGATRPSRQRENVGQRIRTDRLPIRLRMQPLHLRMQIRSNSKILHLHRTTNRLLKMYRLHAMRLPVSRTRHLRLPAQPQLALPSIRVQSR